MTLISRKYYNIICDRCGCALDRDNDYDNKDDLDFVLQDSNWIKDGNKHYCPDCYEYDDDDNIVIKPKDEIM